MTMLKQCVSCGDLMPEEEVEEHKKSNDCPAVAIVTTGPI